MASMEQRNVEALLQRGHVVVDSIAGCGKTTTVLHLAEMNRKKQYLLLTYNAKLRTETKARVKKAKVTNLEVHTFHSYAHQYYTKAAKDDLGLYACLDQRMRRNEPGKYDVIAVDEAQDMKPIFFRMVVKIIVENAHTPHLCILGDRHQCIYGFMGSDARFLTLAPTLLHFLAGEWHRANLSLSYRLTTPMARFVNEAMMGFEKLTAARDGDKPEYIVCKTWGSLNKRDDSDDPVFTRIAGFLQAGYKPDDIFVLGYSVKNAANPLLELESKIKLRGICNTFTPTSDESHITDDVIANKVAFCTFHQAKGRERKIVFVLGFDESYFNYYARTESTDMCPNLLYVATTRATESLILVQAEEKNPLPFLRMEKVAELCHLTKNGERAAAEKRPPPVLQPVPVTDMTRHLDLKIAQECVQLLTLKELHPATDKERIQTKVVGADTTEELSDVTGLAIPAFYEFTKKGKTDMGDHIKQKNVTFKQRLTEIEAMGNKLPYRLPVLEHTTPHFLFLANVYSAANSGFLGRLMQTKKYDWLTETQMRLFADRFDVVLQMLNVSVDRFEHGVELAPCAETLGRGIVGRADLVDADNLVEFKCTQELSLVHYIQIAFYMYMYKASHYYMYNVLSNELVEVSCPRDRLAQLIQKVCEAKWTRRSGAADEDFVRERSAEIASLV